MIELDSVSKYFGKKLIYHKISYRFLKNKSYAIIGPSGSGKTTLLNAIARLEKPDEGSIRIENRDLWTIKEKDYFRHDLGYIFQNYALIEEDSVYENLKMLANKSEIIEALTRVGLGQEYLNQKIYELSGGQAQRVSIARLLLMDSKIILADEPTGALDQSTGDDIIDLLLGLVSENTVVIFATHDPRIYEKVDHIIDLGMLQN